MACKIFVTILALLISVAAGEQIKYCGSQPYYPSQYTCYNGFLCPVVQGERSLKCGSACYLPEAYSCKNGKLAQHPLIKTPFGLVAQNSVAAINGKRVNACGQSFVIGERTCSYCPISNCKGFTNTTLLTGGGGAMQVEVPGGQQTYIESNGAMGFTQAHSAAIPPGATVGYWAAYANGYFQNTRSSGWIACPTGKDEFQVFAKLPGLTFGAHCMGLNIVTVGSPKNTYGAWEYT